MNSCECHEYIEASNMAFWINQVATGAWVEVTQEKPRPHMITHLVWTMIRPIRSKRISPTWRATKILSRQKSMFCSTNCEWCLQEFCLFKCSVESSLPHPFPVIVWILIIASVLQSHLQLNKICIFLPVVFKKPSSGCKPCLSNRFGNFALPANLWILLSLRVRESEEICQAAIDSAALGDLSNTLERSRMSRFRSSGSNPESGRMNLLSFWIISHAIEHIEWQFEEQSEHVKLWYFRNWTKELQSGTDSFTCAGWQEEGQSLEMHRPRGKADLWICLVPGLSRAHSQPSLCWRTSGHWSQAILSRRIGLCWDADWKWEGFNIYGESASVIAKMYCHAVSTSCFLCWHSSLKTSS